MSMKDRLASDSDRLLALFSGSAAALDLTNAGHLSEVQEKAEGIAERGLSVESLSAVEASWAEHGQEISLVAHLAIKLARSKSLLRTLEQPVHLSVVFAVYKENVRILSREQHVHGEDFLREKITQLRWLFEGAADATWDLTVVDDGCPEGSGHIAEQILQSEGESERCRVLFLADAIASGHAAIGGLSSVDESRKGGSIILGMAEAVRQSTPGHVVLYTDADLSTHLGQSGLLIDAILSGGADVAAGSRRERTSVVVKKGGRNLRGKLFIYLWKGLFPELDAVVDTQCGFKAFSADTVRAVGIDLIEKQFAFDVELLLKAQLRRPGSISTVPIAWIDSEAESTTTDLQPYLSMLRKMVAMYRAYLPSRQDAHELADFIESLDEEGWSSLMESVPEGIAEREPFELTHWRDVSVAELRQAVQTRRDHES